MLALLLLCAALPTIPVPTPGPVWKQEPDAYRKVPLGLPYQQMEGRILLTGCKPSSREHESGSRTCNGEGFETNGVAVQDMFVFQDDVFVGAILWFPSEDYEKIRDVFQFKFGEPMRLDTTRVSTASGGRFDNEILNWDGRKASVALERHGETLDKGSATIFLNSHLEAREKERQERLKKDADAF